VVASAVFTRVDLTQDQRYTLSSAATSIVEDVSSPMVIDVFLEGDFPAEFKKLQNETRYILEEFQAKNPNIRFFFSNPIEEGSDAKTVAQQFADYGMKPTNLTVIRNGKETQDLLFPYAMVNYNDQAIPVSLLKNKLGASREALVAASVQNLEYAFADAFTKITKPKAKKIAVLKGLDELPDARIADMFKTLQESYYIAPFPLKAIEEDAPQALKALNKTFDLVVALKPTKPFTDAQKLVIDQYIMNGGKALWLIDQVAMETDSLYSNDGTTLAYPRMLNLKDQFFKYGIRMEPQLVQDLYAAPLTVAQGEGSESQYVQLPWFYQPLVTPKDNHPITTNLEKQIKFNYANPIDTLSNISDLTKTVLLESSVLTKLTGTPATVSLENIGQEPDPTQFTNGSVPLAVLVEGTFTSAFKNRVLPVDLGDIRFRESARIPTKQVFIADGDLIANDIDRSGRPLALGFDKFTFAEYGNKEFLLNTVHYLLDDSGLINIRAKEIVLPFLDRQKTFASLSYWQALCLGLPLGLLAIFGVVYTTIRKRKYAR